MPTLPPYHCNPHTAQALLGPIAATARELDARTRHYLARVRLAGDADRAALEAAQQALATAAAEVSRLAAGPLPRA
ncbi:MAG: hypothetical protein IT340_23650 [Chloroflexi bacterium]|nr:hypothetical protein [Chloroflexota bacterium]